MDNILRNMSDFEKIIFVNNINENDLPQHEISGMSELSRLYPFVMFLTNQLINGNSISNIWHDGLRLTRFIGIDEEHSYIDLGNGHELKLKFNYDTGLIGIFENNPLSRIELISINFNLIDNSTSINNGDDGIINSKYNKFDLVVRFTADISNSSTANIKKINNTLNFYDNVSTLKNTVNFTVNSISEGQNYNSTDQSIEYTYSCSINEDTYKNGIGVNYKLVSPYSSSVIETTGSISLILNPVNYNIIDNLGNELYNGITYEAFNGDNNNEIILRLNFTPNKVTSYNLRKLYVKLKEYDNGLIIPDRELYEINNGICQIKLTFQSNNISFNSKISTYLTFGVFYKDSSNYEYEYTYLEKTYDINLKGKSSNKFIYYGYDNPRNINFGDLIPFDGVNVGVDVLYDWEQITDTSFKDNTSSTFYIAIPKEYVDKIKPRIDAYVIATKNDSEYNSYVSNENSFELYEEDAHIAGQQIDFNLYRSIKFKGFYYGKIQ